MSDPLGASLSEEETENIVPSDGQPARMSTRKTSTSPTQKRPGYKFTEASKPTNFDFASKQKENGQSNSTSSSAESSDHESFVHLNAEGGEENGVNRSGRDRSCPPVTPSKVPTPPHKRTAELVDDDDESNSVANGTPPGSPAPQKKKTKFEEYVEKDELEKAQAKQKADQEHRKERVRSILYCVGFALIAILVGWYGNENRSKLFPEDKPVAHQRVVVRGQVDWKVAKLSFNEQLKQIQKKYPHQNRETWIQLSASILSMFDASEPDHPAAITLLLPPSASPKLAFCFANSIAKAVNVAVARVLNLSTPASPSYLSPDSFDGSRSVTSLREELDSYFASRGKAVVVHDVDKMKTESDLLFFHGLCDNYKAVDKRATILFPLQVPPEVYEKYEWEHARAGDISTDLLNTAFSKVISADSGPALVARIADAVVLLNDGDTC